MPDMKGFLEPLFKFQLVPEHPAVSAARVRLNWLELVSVVIVMHSWNEN